MFQNRQSCGVTLNHSSAESLLDDLMRRPVDTHCFRDSVRGFDLRDEPASSPAWRQCTPPPLLANGVVTLHINGTRPGGGSSVVYRCRFDLIDTYSGPSILEPPEPVVALHPLKAECQRRDTRNLDIADWVLTDWILGRVAGNHQIYICRTDAGARTNTDESLRKQVDDNLRSIFGV